MRANVEVMRAAVLSGRAAPEVERMINSERAEFDLECDARDRGIERELKRLERRSAKLGRILELKRRVAEQEAEVLGVSGRLSRLLSAVCAHYEVPVRVVLSRNREARVAIARHAVCWLALRGGISQRTLAKYLRRKDHGTVLHGRGHIDDLVAVDPEFALDFEQLKLKTIGGGI